MALNFGDYIANPYGKGTGIVPSNVIRSNIENETATMYPAPIRFKAYRAPHQHLVLHCKLPSRTKKDVFYDIVMDFDLAPGFETRRAITKYDCTVFSNSPSFYYTYAKVFREKGALCPWLQKKYERQIMKKSPEKRNPSNIIGYERTLYTGMWVTMQQTRGRSARDLYDNAPEMTYKELAKLVQSQDEIETAYEKAPYTAREQARRNDIKQRKLLRQNLGPKRPSKPKTTAPTSSTVQKTSTTQKTKKTSLFSKIRHTTKTKKI